MDNMTTSVSYPSKTKLAYPFLMNSKVQFTVVFGSPNFYIVLIRFFLFTLLHAPLMFTIIAVVFDLDVDIVYFEALS